MISIFFKPQKAGRVSTIRDLIFMAFILYIAVIDTARGSQLGRKREHHSIILKFPANPEEKKHNSKETPPRGHPVDQVNPLLIDHPDWGEITLSLTNDAIKEYLTDWELKKSSDDISIFCQWIMVDSDKKIRRLMGDIVVQAPASRVLGLIMTESDASDWIYGLEKFNLLDISDEKRWFSYIEFRFPWPIPNYDLVLENIVLTDNQLPVTTIESRSVSEIVGEKPGIKRFKKFQGTWKLISLPDGKTHVKFILFTGMNSNIPVWVTDPIVMKGLMQSLKSMREMASLPASEFDRHRSTSGRSNGVPEVPGGTR